MSSSRCPACGAMFHKGRRRYVLLPDGDLVQRVVCSSCAKRGVTVVPVSRPTPCIECAKDAKYCPDHLNAAVHRGVAGALAPFVEHLLKLAKAYRLNGDGRAEGLTMAADVLLEGVGRIQ